MRPSYCLVVIDPQRGFSELDGTLGSLHGKSELAPIASALAAVAQALRTRPPGTHTVLVRSEYRRGQFGQGPLTNLCVPGMGSDCELAPVLSTWPFDVCFTKSEQDACSNQAFLSWVSEHQARHAGIIFVLCGLLLQHCVAATALGLRRHFGSKLPIVVPAALCGARASSEDARTEALSVLRHAGIPTPAALW